MGIVSESFGIRSSGISIWPSSVVVVIVGGKDCGGVSVLEFAVSCCSPFDVTGGVGTGSGGDMDMGSWFSELIFVVVT